MSDRIWNVEGGPGGRPQTPSTPPTAPGNGVQAASPPAAISGQMPVPFDQRNSGLVPYGSQQSYAAGQPRSGSSYPSQLNGPPPFGERNGWNDSAHKKSSRVGLKVLAAFLAGGVLTGGGFVLGQTLAEEPDTAIDTTAFPTTSSDSSPRQPDIVLTPPDPDSTEPAAFVAAVLGPSIVQIETELGVGSGVVFADGLVMTNHHVVDNATRIRVRTADGRTLAATLTGSDPRVDVAVLDVGEGSEMPIAALALDEGPQVGQAAFALGSPFQLQQSISAGIVSAINRPVSNGEGINAMIQSDTSVNPGNSGGALADRSGRVIGINTSIRTDGVVAGSVGISFSIPIDTAMKVATRILDGESLEPGFLGVGNGQTAANGESGVVIGEVTANSGASEAGLLVGDRVIRINGTPVTSLPELAGLIRANFPGDVVALEIVRGGETSVVEATLGEQ